MKIGTIVLQLAIGAVIVIGGLEICLRAYPATIPLVLLQHFQQDTRLGVAQRLDLPNRYDFLEVPRDDGGPLLRRYRPGAELTMTYRDQDAVDNVVMDDDGFCNPSDRADASEQVEIVALGDSFTWCTAVLTEQTWPRQLASLSGRRTYNLGVAGIGLYEHVQILKQFGLRKRPRVVIMNVYEGNDLRDALRYWDHRNNKGGAQRIGEVGTEGDAWLLRNSLSLNVGRAFWLEWIEPALRALGEEEAEFKKGLDAIDVDSLDFRYVLRLDDSDVAFNPENADRDELRLALAMDQGLIDPHVLDTALAAFAQLSTQERFLAIVSYSPSAYTAYRDYAKFPESSIGPVLERYNARLRDYFHEATNRLGIEFLDLTPALRAEIGSQGSDRNAQLLYFPHNLHYTAGGHRAVAKALSRFLETFPELADEL